MAEMVSRALLFSKSKDRSTLSESKAVLQVSPGFLVFLLVQDYFQEGWPR